MANQTNSKHKRVNPNTGETDYFFPMEILYPDVRDWAKMKGLDIVHTRLGFRNFDAVMVPCKNVIRDEKGNEKYIDTSSEEQHIRYLAYIKDEMNM